MSTLSGNGATGPHRILRFGVFQLDVRTGELRKHGVKVKLQGKPLQVLQALVERPGEILTREELQRRVLTSAGFVEFGKGLHTAGDSLTIVAGAPSHRPAHIV